MLDTLRTHFKTYLTAQEADLKPCTPVVDCEECPNQPAPGPTLPLCLVEAGRSARIVQIDQGRRFRKRLADLGLAVGMDVRVLRASYHSGPMILAVRHDARLAVGWGMANKIRVQVES